MSTPKTAEEILSENSPFGFFIKSAILLSMEKYAAQESREKAIAFAEWTMTGECKYVAMGLGTWCHLEHEEAPAITTTELYDIYLQTIKTPEQ